VARQKRSLTQGVDTSDPQWSSQEDYNAQTPYATGEEATDAVSRLSSADTAVGLLARWGALRDAENQGGTKLSPEEANARYPGMPVPFREPTNPYVAQLLYDREQERQELARKVTLGPQDTWQQTKNFGVGLAAHMTDPIEFGAGAVIGWGVGGALVRTAWGARLAAAGESSFLARTALNTIEAGSGNLVQNVAQEIGVKEIGDMEGIKYDPVEGMKGLALSTFFGTALGVGIKEGSFRMGRYLRNTSPEADLAVLRSQMGEYNEGLKPNVAPLTEALAKETDVGPKDFPGKFNYAYEKITPETIKDRRFFLPNTTGDVLTADSVRPITDTVGEGAHLTDSPGVANAAASRSMSDAPAHVVEIDPANIRPLDLDARLPDDVRESFAEVLHKIVSDYDKAMDKHSGLDIMNAIHQAVDNGDLPASTIKDLQAELKAKGYNAFLTDGSRVGDNPHSPHNLLTLFDDPSELKTKGVYEADPGVRKEPSSESLRDIVESRKDPRRRLEIDSEFYDQAESDLHNLESFVPEQEADDADFFDEFNQMEQQGLLEPSLVKEVEKIKNLESDFKFEDTIMKSVLGCVNG
jgi:hypothetical protein